MSVEVSWESVDLPQEEVHGYRVYYRQVMAQTRKRQNGENVNGSKGSHGGNATSGVIDGLTTGVSYEFQVSALAVTSDGVELEGQPSDVTDDSTAVPKGQGIGDPASDYDCPFVNICMFYRR